MMKWKLAKLAVWNSLLYKNYPTTRRKYLVAVPVGNAINISKVGKLYPVTNGTYITEKC